MTLDPLSRAPSPLPLIGPPPPAEASHTAPSGRSARVDPFQDGMDPAVRAARPVALPPRLKAVKSRIIELTSANTTRSDNIKAVRAELDPLVDELEAWFAANRPRDEVAQTRGAWRSLWYDDANIDRDNGPFRLDRDQIYQVVRDGYYFNVSDNPVVLFGKRLGTTHSFLKGNYDIKDPAGPENRGAKRLNIVNLEFDDNRLRLGKIPRGQDLIKMVDAVNDRSRLTVPIPGPKGITGNLWNAYVDADLRISRGQQDDDPGVTDMYVLRRVATAES